MRNLNSAQIRKDLAQFGEFGRRGVGYSVGDLREHLTKILGLDTPRRVGIVGAGHLGSALANYRGFRASNFTVVALFDNDQKKIGRAVGDARVRVYDAREIARVVRDERVDVAVVAVPARAAQSVLNQLMSAGIKAILNFAPASLSARPGVKVKNVDLTISLETLSSHLARPRAVSTTRPRGVRARRESGESGERELG
ncbi:MAG: redox-sensing transcriptional repressor Rex [Acidobacteria bacterium]|nr:redox-sensing transcriptional repressor Rex [Acidobacteriota bacterium]